MNGYVLLDAGGTEIKSAAFSGDGNRLDEIHSAPSHAREDREKILGNLLDVIGREKKILEAGGYRLGIVGMAFPGPFDYPNGISHIRGLDKYDAIDGVALEKALKGIPGQDVLAPDVRFFFRHDVDSFALGTAAREPACAGGRTICLAIGTGTGSAFLEEGRLVKKGKGAPDDGWIYPFPFRGGIIDDWVSVRGLAKLTAEAGFPAGTSGKDLSGLAAQENRQAAAVWEAFGRLIAEALEPFIASFRPDRLVLGGQISKAEKYFGGEIRRRYPEMEILVISDTTEYILEGLLASGRENPETRGGGGKA